MLSVRRDFFLFLVMLAHTLFASGLFVEPCVDWSSAGLSSSSHEYKDQELQTLPLEELYANAGIMTVRQRLWVQTGDSGDYSLGFNIGLFKRAKAAGIKRLYLDVFLSDTWTDPAQTRGPAVWTSMIREEGVTGLEKTVQNYFGHVMRSLVRAGVAPQIISIGNEVTPGPFGKIGRLSKSDPRGAENTAMIFKAASRAIRGIDETVKILIHTHNGWDTPLQTFFYEQILESGTFTTKDFDLIGLSFYPAQDPSATQANLAATIRALRTRYGKPVNIVEFGWPQACASSVKFATDVRTVHATPQGQAHMIRVTKETIKRATRGQKENPLLCLWEVAWLDNPTLGSGCSNSLMFSPDGTALDGVYALAAHGHNGRDMGRGMGRDMPRDRDRRMIRGKVSERSGKGAKTGRGMRRDTKKRRDRRLVSAPLRKPHARQGQGRGGRH